MGSAHEVSDAEDLGGWESGWDWVSVASETERANLAAVFAGGLTSVIVTAGTYPTLFSVLGSNAVEFDGVLDFGSTPWLVGFRNAVVAQLGGECG